MLYTNEYNEYKSRFEILSEELELTDIQRKVLQKFILETIQNFYQSIFEKISTFMKQGLLSIILTEPKK